MKYLLMINTLAHTCQSLLLSS